MKYSYEIIFDKKQDAWNWYAVSRSPVAFGFAWRDNLSGEHRDFFDKIVKLPTKSAKTEINGWLEKDYRNNHNFYKSQKEKFRQEFEHNFQKAYEVLEKITGKSLYKNHATIYLTTFPRGPYDYQNGAFWFCFSWINPIRNFLHEWLHFQFIHYWQEDPKSAVSKLSKDDFEFIKESLTVVLDDNLKPLIVSADKGYPSHQAFRKLLHRHWARYHDFDELVDYGVKHLPEFTKGKR